ncbi:MAG: TonB-dependent receptor [Hyphomicrobiaceae bacterium]|nr:TonB-dependent receptor [Hyphomicrobiaceae bacterium]
MRRGSCAVPVSFRYLSAFCLFAGWPLATQAQVALPEVSVTAPSPIVRAPPPSALPAQSTLPSVQQPLVLPEQVFVPLTVVPAAELIAAGGANLADGLQYKPGISASTFAAGASRPIIRGLDNTRVSVRENGIGSHDASTLSEDHAVPIDPYAADQVEVVRGPATLRYGSGAIGGVVNVSNERIPSFIPRGGYTAEVRGGVGSADSSFDSAYKVTAGAGNFAVHADGFNRKAQDYNTPNGRQFNSFVDSYGYSVGASMIGLSGFMGVSYTQYNSLYGIPGAEALDNKTRIDMHQEKVQSRGEWRVNASGIEAIRYWVGGSDYRHNEIGFESGAAEVGSRFTNREIEGRVEVQHSPVMTSLGELRGAVGVQLGHRRLTGTSFEGGDSLLDPADTRTKAAYWFEELQFTKRLALQGAFRIEQNDVSGIGRDISDPAAPLIAAQRSFAPVSASFGLLYKLTPDVVGRFTAQYAERAPDAAELFSKGPHEATSTFEIGNPFLNKEVAKSVEVGVRRAKGPLRFDASAYYTVYDGFIFKQQTADLCDDDFASCGTTGTELTKVLFQQRNARFYGVELSAQQDIGKVWRGIWGVDGQYDFVNAEFTDAQGGYVPRIPPHRLGAGIFYRDANWYARTGLLHAFDQTRIGENETDTKGYTLLGADLRYSYKPGTGSPVSEYVIGLKGENLLDQDVRNHSSFQKDTVLQPGRTVRLYGVIKLN